MQLTAQTKEQIIEEFLLQGDVENDEKNTFIAFSHRHRTAKP